MENETINEQYEETAKTLELQIMQKELVTASHEALTAQYTATFTGARLRPCHYCPINLEYDDIRWSCTHLNCPEAIGYGDCPEEAMKNFDKMWLGIRD